jgi:RNA polymerase sigma factor (sigma-70 family)
MLLLVKASNEPANSCQQFESVDRIHYAIRSINSLLYNQVFSCIQKLFFPKTKRFVENHGGNVDDAWDVFQDVSSALLVRIKNEERNLPVDDSGFGGYLMTMVKRTWYHRFRKMAASELVKNPQELVLADENDFLDLFMEMDFTHALSKAMEELSDLEKEFIRLRFYEEKSYKEIEEETGRNAGSLKSNQGRIFSKLKNLLTKHK